MSKRNLSLTDLFSNSSWFASAILFFACFIAYLNSFRNKFLLDDNLVLFGQYGVANKSLSDVLLHNQGGDFYRPIGHILLWVCSRLFGDHVVEYHLFNFILFFLIVYLFFKIAQRLTLDKPLAFLCALLYAVHPINGFIINYITASVIATFVLLMQASFLCFINFCDRKKTRDYVLSLILFAFAFLSHEMAITLPVFLIAYLFFMKRENWLILAKSLIPFVGCIALWFVFRSTETVFQQRLDTISDLRTLQVLPYLSTWMNLVGWYVTKLFYPREIIFLWSAQYGVEHFFVSFMLLSISLAAVVYAFYQWKQGWKPFMLAVFMAGFLPTILSCFVYYPSVWPIIEPHWFYFSEIGFFILLGLAFKMMIQKNAKIGWALTLGVILWLVVSCWEYNSKWEDQETYSRYWLSLNDGNLTPYYGLGKSFMDRGDYANAARLFAAGYNHLNLLDFDMAADWGHCLDVLGKDQDASDLLYTAKKMDPRFARTRYYIGLYFLKHGHPEKAQQAFQKVMELDPKNASMLPLNSKN